MDSRREQEEKEAELKVLSKKNSELLQEYGKLMAEYEKISQEKNKIEQDLLDLMNEYAGLKNKFEIKLEDILIEKDTQIADLKRKLELRGISDTSRQPDKIPEQNEELEELREKLEQKDRIIEELRTGKLEYTNEMSVEALRVFLKNCMFNITLGKSTVFEFL